MDEFYIGWMPAQPGGFARFVRKILLLLAGLVIITGIVLALGQRKFSSASFEYGQPTEVRGIYYHFPVPSLKVIAKQDPWGNATFITMPLVGYGKFGAEGVIAALEKERDIKLDKKLVTLKGTLLYSDGKTLLQVDRNDHPLIAVSDAAEIDIAPKIVELGPVQLSGEILDPKCYFGVMKPGSGKPHRDCAIRCIAGGMSPVLWVRNGKGDYKYYLVLDENGKKMNNELKDYIADPISLTGKAVQYNDWIILYADKKSIKRTGSISWFKMRDEVISCAPSAK